MRYEHIPFLQRMSIAIAITMSTKSTKSNHNPYFDGRLRLAEATLGQVWNTIVQVYERLWLSSGGRFIPPRLVWSLASCKPLPAQSALQIALTTLSAWNSWELLVSTIKSNLDS